MIQGSNILGQGYSWCKGPEVGMSLGSRKRPVWQGEDGRVSSGGAFSGHARETGFSFKGGRYCWRIRKEGDTQCCLFLQCPPVAVGEVGKGTGLSEEQ